MIGLCRFRRFLVFAAISLCAVSVFAVRVDRERLSILIKKYEQQNRLNASQNALIADQTVREYVVRGELPEQTVSAIRNLGVEIVRDLPKFKYLRIRTTGAIAVSVSRLPGVTGVGEPLPAVLNKSNTTEGDVSHKANLARSTFGVTGSGVKVGVISDSARYLSDLQASGDLPANVTVLSGYSGVRYNGSGARTDTGEGTGMMEIIYDLAPGAQLYFASGSGTHYDMASAIEALAAAGCRIIVDDISYDSEPALQESEAVKAINDFVGGGGLYFSCAINYGNKAAGTSCVWEGDFTGETQTVTLGGVEYEANLFSSTDDGVEVTSGTLAYLQWADDFSSSRSGYRLVVLFPNDDIDFGTVPNDLPNAPFQMYRSSSLKGATLMILKPKSAPRQYVRLVVAKGGLSIGTSGATWGHCAASGAFTIAASPVRSSGAYTGSESVETYSSDGPRRIFRDVDGVILNGGLLSVNARTLQKVDFTAADNGLSKWSYLGFGESKFGGTSAAAPHAAAIAALMLEASPKLTRDEMMEILKTSTFSSSGWDCTRGYGIIDAYKAVEQACKIGGVVPKIPAAPTVRVSGSTLSWDAVAGAKYYRVYLSDGPYASKSDWTEWQTGLSCSINPPIGRGNAPRYYWVKAASRADDVASGDFSSPVIYKYASTDVIETFPSTASSKTLYLNESSALGSGTILHFWRHPFPSSGCTAYFSVNGSTYNLTSSSDMTYAEVATIWSQVLIAPHPLYVSWTANTGSSYRDVSFSTSMTGGYSILGWWANAHYFYQDAPRSSALDLTAASVSSSGGTGSVVLTTTGDGYAWTASSDRDWLRPYRTSGTNRGKETVMIGYAVEPNDTSAVRIGTLTIAGKTFTVTQEAGEVPVTLSSISISGSSSVTSGEQTTYTCKANYSDGSSKSVSPSWSIYSGSSYASIGGSSGVLKANAVSSQQSVTICATYGGISEYKAVTVNPKVSAPGTPTNVSATDGTYSDMVSVSWAAASGATSYSLYRSSSSTRPSTATKTGVTSPYSDKDATPGTKYYYWVSAVNSAGSSVSSYDTGYRAVSLSLEKLSDSFVAAGGNGSASVTANTSWTASKDASWITFGTSAGNGNGTLTYTVAANTSSESRTGTITVTAGSGTSYPATPKTLTVTQEGVMTETRIMSDCTLRSGSEPTVYPIIVDGCRVTIESGLYASTGVVFKVINGGELTMNGGEIDIKTTDPALVPTGEVSWKENCFGVWVYGEGSSFTMNDGLIALRGIPVCRGWQYEGCFGVRCWEGTLFCMNGGSIDFLDNIPTQEMTTDHKGVYVVGASAEFHGGSIRWPGYGVLAYSANLGFDESVGDLTVLAAGGGTLRVDGGTCSVNGGSFGWVDGYTEDPWAAVAWPALFYYETEGAIYAGRFEGPVLPRCLAENRVQKPCAEDGWYEVVEGDYELPDSPFEVTMYGIEATITGYNGESTDVEIPEKIGGYPIVAIAADVFDADRLTSISMPAAIPLSDSMFCGFGHLTNVVVRDKADYFNVPWRCFAGCTNLLACTLPQDCDLDIGDEAFMTCGRLQTLNLSDGRSSVSVGMRAFAWCESLETQIPNAVTSLGDQAFYGCESLKEVILDGDLPSAVGAGTFAYCRGLRHAVLPKQLSSVPFGLFTGCTNLVSCVLPEVEGLSIGESAFSGCSSLTNIECLTGCSIERNAFSFSGIRRISLAECTVDSFAFYGCPDLVEVELVHDVWLYSGGDAFSGCGSLQRFVVGDGQREGWSMESDDGVLYCNGQLLCYPAGRSGEQYAIAAGTFAIGDFAFAGSRHLKRISHDADCQTIGNCAFADCSSLNFFDIGGWSWIGHGAFVNCPSLTEFVGENDNGYAVVDDLLTEDFGDFSYYIAYPSGRKMTEWRNKHPQEMYPRAELGAVFGGAAIERLFVPTNNLAGMTVVLLPDVGGYGDGYGLFVESYPSGRRDSIVEFGEKFVEFFPLSLSGSCHLQEIVCRGDCNLNVNAFAFCEEPKKIYVAGANPPNIFSHMFTGAYDVSSTVRPGSEVFVKPEALQEYGSSLVYFSQFYVRPLEDPVPRPEPGVHTVTFDPGYYGQGDMEPQVFEDGVPQKLAANAFEPLDDYKVFIGWYDDAGMRYFDQEEIVVTSNLTLYADWSWTTNSVSTSSACGDEEGFVKPGEWVATAVEFCNLSATSVVRRMTIEVDLSTCLDLNTLRVGGIFLYDLGDWYDEVIPDGVPFSFEAWRQPACKIDCVANVVSGSVLKCELRIVDPTTQGGWPLDKHVGLLGLGGAGDVKFFAKVKDDAPNGAVIANAVRVVFDDGAAIPSSNQETFTVKRDEPETVATPVITPADGSTFDTDSCTVTIACATEGVTIYYSTNGSTPRLMDQFKYTQPFAITGTTTVKAVAVKDGFEQSAVATAVITKVDPAPLTLASALDEPKLSAVETVGDVEWAPVKDATAVDGSSARSGAIGMEQRTCLMATVYGRGTLSFNWKVSCEHDYSGACTWDHMTFSTVEGGRTNDLAKLDGETEWLPESVTFTTDGPHVILWTYSTDDWEESGFEDCGWVDNVVWTGDAPPSDVVIPDVVTLPKAEVESFMAKYPSLAAQAGGDAETFAKLPSAAGKLDADGNQMYVWQDIVAGTDPTNPDDKFKIVDIKFEDGEIKITWSPDLNENGKKNVRAYKEYGRKELGGTENWIDMKNVDPAEKSDYKFRRVTVDMP